MLENTGNTYKKNRASHWNRLHGERIPIRGWYYHRYLKAVFSRIVPPGHRVLELGCGRGDLLASLRPSFGLGVDFSSEAVTHARKRHPSLRFEESEAGEFSSYGGTFDYIVLSDLLNDAWNVQEVFANLKRFCHPRTRIVMNVYSQLWQQPMVLARRLGFSRPLLTQNWLTQEDIRNFLRLTDFYLIGHWPELLMPVSVPGAGWINRYLTRIAPFKWFCLTNFYIARPMAYPEKSDPSCSIVVACRNEAGHIPELIERTPRLCENQELIFVEGGSTDDTYETIEKAISDLEPGRYRLLRQTGKGKGDAVRTGFSEAKGDVLMILDADMTVAPEDIRLFYDAIAGNRGEFINGVRMVYPMEDKAMRFFNLIGNKFFAKAFSWLLGQPVRDTLCGTKVLWREDYLKIAANRHHLGDIDPFGDFDLLFGAARLNLQILEIPIRYGARKYGETNISRWSHGWLLLRMCVKAASKIKFAK
jgi:SAM-dependent methyltransferase